MKLALLTKYALKGIRRGGQRVLLAVLAVAFGVMSLVAMAGLSEVLFESLLLDPRQDIGGDARLWRAGYLTAEQVEQFEAWQESGVVERYAVYYSSNSGPLILTTPGSGRVSFVRNAIGFEAGGYPLLGEIVVGDPAGAAATDLLRQPGDVIITKDLAEERGVSVGDTVLVGSEMGGAPEPLQVAGIATNTPNYQGASLFFNLETARLLTGHSNPLTTVNVIWADEASGDTALEELLSSGWYAHTPDMLSERNRQMRDMMNLLLKGAGILGLMVGGIGIANTMQVMLARRREEVGVLKTLGYARRDILLLFVIETAILGLVGSVLGAAAGVGLSAVLVRISQGFVTLFLIWRPNMPLVLGSVAVGVITAVLFAMNAILRASDVRPADVFRQLPPPPQSQIRSIGTFALMAVPFGAITSLVLGSLWQGGVVLLAALAGLIVLGGLLAGIKWLVVRLLPTFGLHLLRMARNNLRRRGVSLVFAMIALFAGTYTLGFAMVSISGTQNKLEEELFSTGGYNFLVLTGPEGVDEAQAALAEIAERTGIRYETPVETFLIDGEPVGVARYLQGRDEPWDIVVEGAAWGSVENGAYVPAGMAVEPGATIEVVMMDGRVVPLTVVGTYEIPSTWESAVIMTAAGIVTSSDTLLAIAGDEVQTSVAAEVAPNQLEAQAEAIGRALPQTAIITAAEMNDSFKAAYQNLGTFAITMSGLALLAGAVLIANAVSLTMIERRHEIGVMKAVGYTRGHVLRTVLFEYGLVAAIASVVGLLAVLLTVYAMGVVQEITREIFLVPPMLAGVIIVVGVGLTLVVALAAAWRPTSIRPVVVLADRG